jgi:Fe-S cluster assembly protein SufD
MMKHTTPLYFIRDWETYQNMPQQKHWPNWWKERRQACLTLFAQLGIPTIKDEEWKYTNLKPYFEIPYTLTTKNGHSRWENLTSWKRGYDVNLVCVNGIFRPELSDLHGLPAGISVSSLAETLARDGKHLSSWLAGYQMDKEGSFALLNQALSTDGMVINVADKTVTEKLIHILHVTDAADAHLLTNPHIICMVGTSAQVTLLETYCAFTGETYCVNALTDIYLAPNAICHYNQAQSESSKATHIGTTRVWQERDAVFDGFSLTVGGAITRNNLDIILNGEGVQATLNGLYSVREKQHVDNHTSVDHRFPNGTSNQLYKGILNDQARAVFNGKIFVRPIAQLTNSYQLNKNLILGNECRVDTKPQLEIFADDVKCTHGATIGQLNEDEIFYLQTRAIPKPRAVEMLSHGFVDDILNKIQHPQVREHFQELVQPTFAAMV